MGYQRCSTIKFDGPHQAKFSNEINDNEKNETKQNKTLNHHFQWNNYISQKKKKNKKSYMIKLYCLANEHFISNVVWYPWEVW